MNESNGPGGEIAGDTADCEFWVKGNNNFTIETIVRIEEVLGVELIGVRVG
ncbi:hypothetical protein [Dyadobacter sp. CY323]|uniref:hypothetical protein n=1 Tax=Dyadobacter sp. CY323 TaxID=2907302 RepID=UPI001F3D1E76|nr:hypothetical protein [Dyadobacter sp. CY323]MCE6991499.1 hypothetical protein [Dyadobacter sp. CY323]